MKKAFFLLCFSLLCGTAYAKKHSLDQFLTHHGYSLSPMDSSINEGYCTVSQQQEFIKDLRSYNDIKNILEIGFNAGHSAELFLKTCPSARVVSFDLNSHAYTQVGVDFFQQYYSDRFTFIQGDSKDTIPQYALEYPQKKFDLIYIDGGHSFEECQADILNCKALANPQCILWIDDYWEQIPTVRSAVDLMEQNHLIRILDKKQAYESKCGDRSWVIAQYIMD